MMFLGQDILRQNNMVIEPSGMLLHLSGTHCLEASREVIPFHHSQLLWRLISSTVTENPSNDGDGVSASSVDGDTDGVNMSVCVFL